MCLFLINFIQSRKIFHIAIIAGCGVFYATCLAAQESYDESFIQSEYERLKLDPDNSVTISVNAPIEYVYQFLLERLDLYVKNVESVMFDHRNSDRSNEFATGSVRTTVMANGGALQQRFVKADSPFSYAYFTDITQSSLSVPLKYSLANYEFEESGAKQTTVKISVVYQPSSRLTGFIVRRAFNYAFKRDFDNAARVMNQQYDP